MQSVHSRVSSQIVTVVLACLLAVTFGLLAAPMTAQADTTITGMQDLKDDFSRTHHKITIGNNYVRTWNGSAYGKNDFSGDTRHYYKFVAPANGKATFSGKMNYPSEDESSSISVWFEDSGQSLLGLIDWGAGEGATASFSKTSPKLAKGETYVVVVQPGFDHLDATYSYSFKLTFKASAGKKDNTVTVASKKVTKTLKAKKLKKKAVKVKLPKVKANYGTPKWKVTKKDSKGVLKLKGKKIVVKKGAKKGTYKMKLRAKVKEGKSYQAAKSKVVTVKIKVK